MMDYDRRVSCAKMGVTDAILDANDRKVYAGSSAIATAVDELNAAWDAMTYCLVRQNEERDRIIRDLIDQLAEAKKGK